MSQSREPVKDFFVDPHTLLPAGLHPADGPGLLRPRMLLGVPVVYPSEKKPAEPSKRRKGLMARIKGKKLW